MADNTQQSYRTGLSAFQTFRTNQHLPLVWPPEVEHIVQFIAHLSIHGYKPATAKTYVRAIGFHCKLYSEIDPTNRFIVSKLLEGMKRLRHKSDTRLPITLSMLNQILHKLGTVCTNKFETKLFSAAFTLAFFGFLRVGEITLSKGSTPDRVLSRNDVILQQHALNIHIRQSKNDQYGKGVHITIQKVGGLACPVRNMAGFLDIRPAIQGPLFCHYGGTPLTRYQFSAILNKVLTIVGFDTRLYKTHSFRIGAVSRAYEMGHSDADIQAAGRWRSDAFKTYIRSPTTFINHTTNQ